MEKFNFYLYRQTGATITSFLDVYVENITENKYRIYKDENKKELVAIIVKGNCDCLIMYPSDLKEEEK